MKNDMALAAQVAWRLIGEATEELKGIGEDFLATSLKQGDRMGALAHHTSLTYT